MNSIIFPIFNNSVVPILDIHVVPRLDNPVFPRSNNTVFSILDNSAFSILDKLAFPILDNPVFPILDSHVFPLMDNPIFPVLANPPYSQGSLLPRLSACPIVRVVVLFIDTRDDNPDESDSRTQHEALPVVKGLKKGLNVWVYNYNYRNYWAQGCTSIMYADMLGGLVKPSQPSINFVNKLQETVKIMWLDVQTKKEVQLGALAAGQESSFDTFTGHQFLCRTEASNEVVGRHTATAGGKQNSIISRKSAAKAADEL